MNNLDKIKKTELETLKTFKKEIPSIDFNHFNDQTYKIFENFYKKIKIITEEFFDLFQKVLESINNVKFVENLKKKLVNFILEPRKLVDLLNGGNFDEVKKFVEKCSLLIKGPYGVLMLILLHTKKTS